MTKLKVIFLPLDLCIKICRGSHLPFLKGLQLWGSVCCFLSAVSDSSLDCTYVLLPSTFWLLFTTFSGQEMWSCWLWKNWLFAGMANWCTQCMSLLVFRHYWMPLGSTLCSESLRMDSVLKMYLFLFFWVNVEAQLLDYGIIFFIHFLVRLGTQEVLNL